MTMNQLVRFKTLGGVRTKHQVFLLDPMFCAIQKEQLVDVRMEPPLGCVQFCHVMIHGEFREEMCDLVTGPEGSGISSAVASSESILSQKNIQEGLVLYSRSVVAPPFRHPPMKPTHPTLQHGSLV